MKSKSFNFILQCWIVDEIETIIVDQDNCKLIQDRLDREPSLDLYETVFHKVIDNFDCFTKDQFANYFCQKIVDQADDLKISMIVDKLSDQIVEISKNSHGTRVLQKVIEKVLYHFIKWT